MNPAKKIATGVAALGVIFTLNTQAQSNDNGNAVAFNNAAKTEMRSYTPVIKTGGAGEARVLSGKNSALVIHISGGQKDDRYTAEQYARMLQVMFRDPKRTEFPTDISVVYDEDGGDRHTFGSIYTNGYTYDKNGGAYQDGDGVLHPTQMVKLIPVLTKIHAEKNGLITLNTTKPEESNQVVASNNLENN
ncbi:hypothetical protein [Roseivirga pacifica]|uniref:hypothetical protein n=1 Tax=Roseivirga pacifica TaxID=1267423 RepID=UPI00227D476D|nr:hypothetical protein [Roseivirga pacifica]